MLIVELDVDGVAEKLCDAPNDAGVVSEPGSFLHDVDGSFCVRACEELYIRLRESAVNFRESRVQFCAEVFAVNSWLIGKTDIYSHGLILNHYNAFTCAVVESVNI